MEELLVELLVALLAPHREEDVAPDELVDHLAVRGQALQTEIRNDRKVLKRIERKMSMVLVEPGR